MIRFHPDDNMLVEYSAGSLASALGMAVKAHLQMCPSCRERVSQLNVLGSMFLMGTGKENQADGTSDDATTSFKHLMTKIKSVNTLHASAKHDHDDKRKNSALPAIISRLLPDKYTLKWRRVSPSLKQANLVTGQSQFEVCLHKIGKGGAVAHHDHRGMEVTLVLKGAFSDEDGSYEEGDFLVRYPGEKHRPCATQNQDCLCLSLVEAPVKLSGLLGIVVNPFLSFKPG